jgi:beta-glucosidase
MTTLARLAIAALLVLDAAGARAAAAPRPQCQAAIAAAGRQILRRSLTVLAVCAQRVARGDLPPSTNCLTDPTTSPEREAAVARAVQRIDDACTDGLVAQIAPAGDCSQARTVADLVACIPATHDGEAETLVAVANAARSSLSARGQSCESQASRQTRAFALARLRLIQQCKQRPALLRRLAPGSGCAAEPHTAARIAALRARAAGRVASQCDAAALAETPFGAPCDALASGAALAECLLSAAETAGDGALTTEFPDEGFCGDSSLVVESRIDDLLAQMTLAEKTAQMHGSGIITGSWHTTGVAHLGIPGLGMVDGARGVGIIAGNATAFPVSMARAATWDPSVEERVGEAIGAEARAKTASVILAPTINMLRHPRWGRAQETYGEDTFHLGHMGAAFVRGAQRHVIANPKHYAANSIENTRFSVDVTIDERTLREIYLSHFRRTVTEGHAASVMSAYNLVNGAHCAENAHLLHDVLKGDWAFQGFVESDWIVGTRSTVPSALAGLDIEMPSGVYFGQPLIDAVNGAQVPQATIDGAVRRILRAQLCFRLDTDPPVADPSQVETAAHTALALEAEQKAIVLLKNAGGALPLDRSLVSSVAVVGPLASMANLGDHGSSWVTPSSAVAPLAGIVARAGSVTVTSVPGPAFSPADQAAIAAADAAVVVVGLTFNDESEGLTGPGDRTSLVLPGGQDALVAAVAALNPRTVVVLEGSGPVVMPWVNDVAAIVMAWYPGVQGGNAIADVLFGDVNPSGKLPLSFPVAEADLPPFDNVSLAVTYDYFHGYRYLDRNGTAALFPFGFGLSYTSYQYANLKVAPATLSRFGRVRVTADVTNTGTVAGDEIAQLYVAYPGSGVTRAVRDLKGFTRVHLEAGETRTVAFDLRAADLAYWDTGAGGWTLEPLTYTVEVGRSSQDLPLTGSVTVAP